MDGGSKNQRRQLRKKLAQKLADEWEQLAKAGRARRLIETQCRKVIAEMYERTVGEPLHFRTARCCSMRSPFSPESRL